MKSVIVCYLKSPLILIFCKKKNIHTSASGNDGKKNVIEKKIKNNNLIRLGGPSVSDVLEYRGALYLALVIIHFRFLSMSLKCNKNNEGCCCDSHAAAR